MCLGEGGGRCSAWRWGKIDLALGRSLPGGLGVTNMHFTIKLKLAWHLTGNQSFCNLSFGILGRKMALFSNRLGHLILNARLTMSLEAKAESLWEQIGDKTRTF